MATPQVVASHRCCVKLATSGGDGAASEGGNPSVATLRLLTRRVVAQTMVMAQPGCYALRCDGAASGGDPPGATLGMATRPSMMVTTLRWW